MTFPKVDKKLTKGLDPVNFVLSNEGDEMAGQYAGSIPDYKLPNGKRCIAHVFVTTEGVATILQRKQIDAFLLGKKVKVGTDVRIVRKDDKEFKKDGETRTMHQFDCEVA